MGDGINFIITLDGQPADVWLAPMMGLTSFHLSINRYYQGSFHTASTGWMFHGNEKGEAMLTTADREVLLDMIFEYIEKHGGKDVESYKIYRKQW